MRELALIGLVAVLAGIGSYYGIGEMSAFAGINLAGGGLALTVALGLRARRLRDAGGPHARAVVLRGLALIAAAFVLGIGLERAAAVSGVRFDWTLEESFEISPAVIEKLAEITRDGAGPVHATLYFDPEDPRVRRSRLLLDQIERVSDGAFVPSERSLLDFPEDADVFAIGSSNTVVLKLGDYFETVPRPGEGSIFEGLYRLHGKGNGTLVFLRGEGEGNIQSSRDTGYAGLTEALGTEGYRVESRVSAGILEVPDGTDAVVAIGAQRRLLPSALEAVRRYLDRGGSLVAMLEPGVDSGLEELLAEWGIEPMAGLVVDPASVPIAGRGVEGIGIVAYNYEVEPVTLGLNSGRMTYLPGVRPFHLRKPQVGDRVRRAVMSSHRAWVSEDLAWLGRSSGRPEHAGQPTNYQTLVAMGEYSRKAGRTRIVAFGDAEFASNRWLRTLYNLDLALNAIHWATENEPAITLRPKVRTTVQFPLPLNNSVQALYGVGLLLPELLLIAGGIVWLRRRRA